MQTFPDDRRIWRNALLAQEYDLTADDAARFTLACQWAERFFKQPLLSSSHPPKRHKKLRIGFLSPDLNRHPVGLLLLPVIRAHDRARFDLYAYCNNRKEDEVSREIASLTHWRTVDRLSDAALSDRIRQDRIDILVDLAGHTQGSRVEVFAARPAPVQLSWLGYFATTGLKTFDAVLMDEWLVPAAAERWFTEPVTRIPGGRFCYEPVPFAPEVAPLPALAQGVVTFGSFNNTAKLNESVLRLWAELLKQIPNSRLFLKCETFIDRELNAKTRRIFADAGIAQERLELQGASAHGPLLHGYGQVDISLDPFPFGGGYTSLESLWMGVPVITWPQSRVAGRQTYSFLKAIGLDEFIAADEVNYLRIAKQFADDLPRLAQLRAGLRDRMRASPLMDAQRLTRYLEQIMVDLYDQKAEGAARTSRLTIANPTSMKKFLHVGCGPKSKSNTTPGFNTAEWQEIRFDIDASVKPDLVGTMTDMSAVASESVDAIFSSHNIEHLYPHEVPVALKEFRRVLKPDGFLVITCPDLQSVCQLVADDKLLEAAYSSPAGPIAALDILYGHRPAMAAGNLFMAHRYGFTERVLSGVLREVGFATVGSRRRPKPFFDLYAVATKSSQSEEMVRNLAKSHFPQ